MAFASVTTDPRKGTDQTSTEFWNKVKAKYDTLYQPKSDDDQNFVAVERTPGALISRFQKQIQKDVNVFNAYYHTVTNENHSGWDKQMNLDAAAERFNEGTGYRQSF